MKHFAKFCGVWLVILTLGILAIEQLPWSGNGRSTGTSSTVQNPLAKIFDNTKRTTSWGQVVDLNDLGRFIKPRSKKSKRKCPIIADDDIDTYIHELAHCNGWTHPEKITNQKKEYYIPPKYIHAFNGQVIVTVANSGKIDVMAPWAQKGTLFTLSSDSPPTLCMARAKGAMSTARLKEYYANSLGCAPVGGE